MKDFVRQFLPALAAGMLVLLASYFLLNPGEQSGSLRYSRISHFSDVRRLAKANEYVLPYEVDFIRIYNFGDEDLKDFNLIISGFRLPSLDPTLGISSSLDGVVTAKAIDSSLVGQDGVMRIPVSKFEGGGTLDVVVDNSTLSNFSIDTSQNGIEVLAVSEYSVSNRSNEVFSGIISFLSALAAMFASVLTYLVGREKEARRTKGDSEALIKKIEEYASRAKDD